MKQLLCLLFAAVAVTACAPAVPAGEFRIVGKIENVPDSAVIYLYETRGRILREIAVDTLIDGRFSFRDTVNIPKIVQIWADGEGYPNWLFDVWVASGQCVKITGQDKIIGLWDISSKIPEQRVENEYRAEIAPEMREMMRLQLLLDNSFVTQKQRDSLRILSRKQQGLMSAKTVRYMQTVPITDVWMNKMKECAQYLQYGIGTDSKAGMFALYDRLSEVQRQSPKARQINAYLNPAPAVGVGDRLADGDLYDVDGKLHRLTEFLGKYILLDFWSAGCGPCVMAVPELKEIAERYKDRVAVVSISLDPEPEWKEFVTEKQLTGNQWNELVDGDTGLGMRYGVKGIPHFVLIAPDGRIRDVWQGYGKGSLQEKIAENIK